MKPTVLICHINRHMLTENICAMIKLSTPLQRNLPIIWLKNTINEKTKNKTKQMVSHLSTFLFHTFLSTPDPGMVISLQWLHLSSALP